MVRPGPLAMLLGYMVADFVLVRGEDEESFTAVDCGRTVEFDRGRTAADIALDVGRGWCGGGGEKMFQQLRLSLCKTVICLF